MFVLEQVGRALLISFSMLWEVLWPLALGFLLSAVVQSVVSRQAVAGTLGRFDLRARFPEVGWHRFAEWAAQQNLSRLRAGASR